MVAALVSAVVGALVGAALSPVTNNVLAQVFKLLEKDSELWEGFKKDMIPLKTDLRMLLAKMEDQLSGKRDPSAVSRVCMKDMQDLSYDIQDCMDRIRCYSECRRGDFRELADEVKSLKERLLKVLSSELQKSSCIHDSQSSSTNEERGNTEVKPPVGIEKPMEELRKVLEGHPEELSVITIVGFSGLGKTTLARAVYDCYDGADQFQCRAWVVASEHKDITALLNALQKELFINDPQSHHFQSNITSFLKNKRYLIALDDINEQQWDHIKSTFPVEKRSRIIVTTTILGLGKLCSKHGKNGYVYNMRPLEERHSKKLLNCILKNTLSGFDQNSALLVEKLDGHPLSLVSVANYLQKYDEFPEKFCSDLGRRMMMNEAAFSELQQVLINYFGSLQGDYANLRILLLYICVFPNKHAIRRSRLIRRWLAEGYVEVPPTITQRVAADQNLDQLVDQNIIRPIDPSKKARPKTLRAHGIMHEFLLHIARSTNFITDLGNPRRHNYRHLFLEGRPSTPIGGAPNVSGKCINEKEELLRAHSLTVSGSAGEAVGCLPKCELLRVLDLEECNELEDRQTVDIHKLWHLKYLSLGAKITKVPSQISKLHCLETLDMRKTKIGILPVEAIKLPHLAHLLGKFKLEKQNWEKIKADNLLPPRSNFRTLTGFLTDDDPGFPMLMVHMKELNKVKIWCNSVGVNAPTQDSTPSDCFTFLLTAIKLFIQKRLDTPEGDHCLSLDLGNSSEDILTSLHKSIQLSTDHSPESSPEIPRAYLSSLKLHGELHGLTQIIGLVGGLKELCLSSTNGLTLAEVSNLSKLIDLVYLKLVGINLEGLVIKTGDFRALRRLCLVKCIGFPEIRNGALTDLLSLRVLSNDPDSLSGIQIKNLIKLQEVGLDSELNQKTKTEWEDAAKEHPKRPRVLFFERVRADGTGSMVKYVAAKTDIGSSEVREEQRIPTVQLKVEVEVKPAAAQENRDGISSDSQNSNSGVSDTGLKCGKSSHDCCPEDDDHGNKKRSNHDTCDEDEGEGKHDKIHNGYPDGKEELVTKETLVEGARKSAAVTPVDNSNGKGKEDAAMQGKRDKELTAAKAGQSTKMATDDRLKQQCDDPVMVKAN